MRPEPWIDDALASNGRAVSDNFRAWFGTSSVSGADGQPLMLYHATDVDFDSFDHTEDIGFHFGGLETVHLRLAHMAGEEDALEGACIVPVYLSIQNPLRLRDLHTLGSGAVAGALRAAGIVSGDEVDALRKYNDREIVFDLLKAKRFDGIVYTNETEGGGDSWIAFDACQVKCACGNSSLFLVEGGSLTDTQAAEDLRRAVCARAVVPASKLRDRQQRSMP